MNLKENVGPIGIIIAVVAIIGIIIFVVVKAEQPDSVNPNGPVGQPPGYAKGNVSAGQPPANIPQQPQMGGGR